MKRPNALWSGRPVVLTVLPVGSDAEHAAYKRLLGRVLSEARTKLSDYTQQTIAEQLSVDKETIGRWERGEREPRAYQLHRMATLYCAPVEPPWDLFLNPPDSMTQIDLRVASLRAAAVAAAEAEAEADDDPPSDDGKGVRRGTR